MITLSLVVLGTTLSVALPAFAQDAKADTVQLPETCMPMMKHDMGSITKMDMSRMDQPHQDLAAGIDAANDQMMQGMMAGDIDVAFVCGLIPHHKAAINMAKAESQARR